jgi:hypothetical protein
VNLAVVVDERQILILLGREPRRHVNGARRRNAATRAICDHQRFPSASVSLCRLS